MSCQNKTQDCNLSPNTNNGNIGYIILIVLYILLAIILGSYFF